MQAPAGSSDTASGTTAGGGGLGDAAVVLAAEGLAQAVQPLLTSSRGSEAGDNGSPAFHHSRRGYRSDPDEPQQQPQALGSASASAPSVSASVPPSGVEAMGGGGAGAMLGGVKRTVKAGVQAGMQAGHQLGRHLLPHHSEQQRHGHEGAGAIDVEQGAGGNGAGSEATRGSVYEGQRRDVQSVQSGAAVH